MKIDNRDFKKTNAGMNNVYLDRTLYFDNIVSMRVTKSLDDEKVNLKILLKEYGHHLMILKNQLKMKFNILKL